MWLRLLPYAGWPLAGLMFWFWIGVKEDLAAEIERCNSDKLQTALESSELARTAQQEAADRRIAELEALALDADNARRIADAARLEVESRPERVRTVIREVANVDACIDSSVPVRLLDCVRDASGCGPADHS